jgi:hypothetical protein
VRLRILDLANADLMEGFRFYERQEEGVGSYFLETLLSDIESLSSREFIDVVSGIIACCPKDFPSQFTTTWKGTLRAFGVC